MGTVSISYYRAEGTVLSVSNEPDTREAEAIAAQGQPVTLANGTTARVLQTHPSSCDWTQGAGMLAVFWAKDGTMVRIQPFVADDPQLTKAELLKIAASLSPSAELVGSQPRPPFPAMLPTPRPTDPSCPSPLPQAVPSHGPLMPQVEPTNHP